MEELTMETMGGLEQDILKDQSDIATAMDEKSRLASETREGLLDNLQSENVRRYEGGFSDRGVSPMDVLGKRNLLTGAATGSRANREALVSAQDSFQNNLYLRDNAQRALNTQLEALRAAPFKSLHDAITAGQNEWGINYDSDAQGWGENLKAQIYSAFGK